jgi:hypothetical protein
MLLEKTTISKIQNGYVLTLKHGYDDLTIHFDTLEGLALALPELVKKAEHREKYS